ncbi:ribonuclease H-like domain-containing protein [Bombardia bombarda]|uniref:Ribonuclease H-like domain-containing protein n=1 Tax=Bombardia bombarda TaxID=252184 RepID=A0AA39X714_9PEZI|nr:ribonuclease H-like domain-containing protein [Bombardia bombarda]
MASSDTPALVWIDCEMTGLNPDSDAIIEIFCLISDDQLKLLEPVGLGIIVHQPKERLDAMGDWCIRQHAKTGLTAAAIQSTVTPEQAANELLAYIQTWVPRPHTALLAGNTVHADKAFLRKEPYKKVIDHLHYRILDVSSLKETALRWCPDIAAAAPAKEKKHRAMQDILESLQEADYYKSAIFQTHKP